jgi:hypothetical protein
MAAPQGVVESQAHDAAAAAGGDDVPIDPVLIEAMRNPKHRQLALRVEQDLTRFMRSPECVALVRAPRARSVSSG